MKLVLCDFNRTLYDPAKRELFPGAFEMLDYFNAQGAFVVLYSTETKERGVLLDELHVTPHLSEICFVTQKTPESVQAILDRYAVAPQDALVIGDDPDGELSIGHHLGIPTIAVGTGFCDRPTAQALGATYCVSLADVWEGKL